MLESTEGSTVLDEVVDVIHLPAFDADAVRNQQDHEKLELDVSVTTQLRDFVTIIATLYRNNPFHSK